MILIDMISSQIFMTDVLNDNFITKLSYNKNKHVFQLNRAIVNVMVTLIVGSKYNHFH